MNMKQILSLIGFSSTGLLLALPAPAYANDTAICNGFHEDIWLAYQYIRPSRDNAKPASSEVIGWFQLSSGECRDTGLSRGALMSLHAHNRSNRYTWSGNDALCVANTAFNISTHFLSRDVDRDLDGTCENAFSVMYPRGIPSGNGNFSNAYRAYSARFRATNNDMYGSCPNTSSASYCIRLTD